MKQLETVAAMRRGTMVVT